MGKPRDEIDREQERVEDDMMSADDSRYDHLREERDRLDKERAQAEERAELEAEYRDKENILRRTCLTTTENARGGPDNLWKPSDFSRGGPDNWLSPGRLGVGS